MRFLRHLITLALALLPGLAAAECTGDSLADRLTPPQRATLDAAVAATPYPEGLIWEARRDGQRIVLAGTMHLWDPRIDPIAAAMAPHLLDSRMALFEMTRTEQAEMTRAIARDPSLTVITDGPTLPELLDEATWAALSAAAAERGIPGFMAAKMRPWFLALSLATPSCATEALLSGRQGLDFQLMDMAAANGIPMSALEPWDTLFSLFRDATLDEQIDFLRVSLMAPEVQDAMFVAMLDGYLAGRVAEIWELNRLALDMLPDMADAEAMFAQTEATLLVDRNRAWIPVIEAAAATHGRLFVAAGAAHLPGENGLLRMLELRGWTIARLDD